MTDDTRFDELNKSAKEYHYRYPTVWKLFVQKTLQLIDRGFNHYTAQGIFEWIRCETDTPDVDGRSTFKVNNNHVAFYARWFMAKYPAHDGFFRLRDQKSKHETARHLPELTPAHFDRDGQGRLL